MIMIDSNAIFDISVPFENKKPY